MYIVSEFIELEINLGALRQNRLESFNPRDFQDGLDGAVTVTLPSTAVGSEIKVFCERLQSSTSVEIDGTDIDTKQDVYLERSRAIRTFTPADDEFTIDLGLTGQKRAGTVIAWLASKELEISSEVFVSFPFGRGIFPRVTTDRKEDGEEIVYVIGDEPRLVVTINIRGVPPDDPDPDDKMYKILRAMSPQREFFFYGRNISEAWIIGKSSRRVLRHVYVNRKREAVQPVVMEVL